MIDGHPAGRDHDMFESFPIGSMICVSTLALTLPSMSVAQDVPTPQRTDSTTALTITASPLVGEYWYSEDLESYSLKLAADGSFVWKLHGCLGVYGQNKGTYEIVEGLLILDPVNDQTTSMTGGKRFIPVTWGDRLYLIPQAIRGRFRDAILQSIEPRSHTSSGYFEFYLRDGDWKKPVSGVPAAPEPWQDLFRGLAPKRIEATVTKLWSTTYQGSNRTFTTNWARLNVGKKHGMRRRMWLTIRPSRGAELGSHARRLLAVHKVGEETAEAKIIVSGAVAGDASLGVRIGDVATITICTTASDETPVPLSLEQRAAREAAQKIMTQVAHIYASCNSYKDQGLVETVFIEENGEETTLKPF